MTLRELLMPIGALAKSPFGLALGWRLASCLSQAALANAALSCAERAALKPARTPPRSLTTQSKCTSLVHAALVARPRDGISRRTVKRGCWRLSDGLQL